MRKLIRNRPARPVFWSPTSSDPMARRAEAWGSRLSTASTRGSTIAPKIPSADTATRADHEAVQIARHVQRFVSIHDQIANLFHFLAIA